MRRYNGAGFNMRKSKNPDILRQMVNKTAKTPPVKKRRKRG